MKRSKHKRLELTDTELALGMWLYITLNVARTNNNELAIPYLKRWYLGCHNKDRYYWESGCYLCEKYANDIGCRKCPLHKAQGLKPIQGGCSSGTWYDKICSYFTPKEEKLSYCCKIVDVMRREV